MHTITDHNDKIAATLTSLSFEPAANDPPPPKKHRSKGAHAIAIMTMIGIIAAFLTAAIMAPNDDAPLLVRMKGLFSEITDVSEPGANARLNATSTQTTLPLTETFPTPSNAPAPREITGSGFVVTPRFTAVFSKYEGRITNIAVVPGDRVAQGQILVTLEDANADFALEQALADKNAASLSLAAAMIDLKQARTTLDRIEILAKRDAVSKQRLDETRTMARSAANNVEQARQKIESTDLAIRIAKERLAELVIRAPFAGTVTHLNAHTGDTVLARADSVRDSQSLLTLADTQHMMIDADVAETNIASLHPGLRGEAVLDGFPNYPFPVEVTRLSPVVSLEKGTITLRLSLIDPPKGMRPNMAARIRLLLPHQAKLHESSLQTGDVTQ
ncbi:efflux RND transporter periplasmic adaptor subunit [Thalassospira sp. TSL5-1]|uniref:efflux RND transporter periplasmic adaptor subunit n=1 Tax=Thalassospira sp. TSL5-1 TaxID=1544451 RepID=UPI0009FAB534|nr:efflux RND transporter periplasmic adaptor subunit [Thalassospira sp. TSL5-1]